MHTQLTVPSTLGEFLADARDELSSVAHRTWPPLYTLEPTSDHLQAIVRLRRQPFAAQFHVAAALENTLRQHQGAALIGEPSSGKTMTALCVAAMLGVRRAIVLAPAHLLGNHGKWAREIHATIPDARVTELRKISDVDRFMNLSVSVSRPAFALLSRDRAKLGSPWRHVAGEHYTTLWGRRVPATPGAENLQHLKRDEDGQPVVAFHCLRCGKELADLPRRGKDGRVWDARVWTAKDFEGAPKSCPLCGETLFCHERLPSGGAMYPLGRYFARRYRGACDLLIADEMHEYKAGGSAQGMMLGTLAHAARYTLGLTATIMSGYASSLFYILHRISPTFRGQFAYSKPGLFVGAYGLMERVREEHEEVTLTKTGKRSSRMFVRNNSRELPGVSPAVLTHVLDRAAFIHLPDLKIDLPPYRECVSEITMAAEQQKAYDEFLADLRGAVGAAYRGRNVRVLGGYLQALLSWPDAPWRGDAVRDPGSGELVATAAALPDGVIYPKEQVLIDLLRGEAALGRKVLVYCIHTGTRDLLERLHQVLAGAGLRPAVLRASTSPRARETWLQERASEVDCVLTSPRLVGSGLDLVQFSTVVWVEPEYSTYTVRQASRRTWRIGQTQPVNVHFLVYRDTLQANALAHVARGILAASMVDGEIMPDGRLAAADSRGDILLKLAAAVVGGNKHEDLGDLLRRAASVEAAQAGLLGDREWTAPAVPLLVPVTTRTVSITMPSGAYNQMDLFGGADR